MMSHLLIVDLRTCTIGVLFRKFTPGPMYSRLFLTFSSIRFTISGFMLSCLIPWTGILIFNRACLCSYTTVCSWGSCLGTDVDSFLWSLLTDRYRLFVCLFSGAELWSLVVIGAHCLYNVIWLAHAECLWSLPRAEAWILFWCHFYFSFVYLDWCHPISTAALWCYSSCFCLCFICAREFKSWNGQ